MIIDANDLVIGRLGTVVAKKALLGEKVDIVNCEQAVITGKKQKVLADYKQTYNRGIPVKGPFHHSMPDKFVKRAIRGMLPYKKERGKIAFKNIMCHVGIPSNLKDQKMETVDDANVNKMESSDFVKVKDICKFVGAKLE